MVNTQRVVLRGIEGPVYARKGEATYCENGHLLGHFNQDALVGETDPYKLTPVDGMGLFESECPICSGAVVQNYGQYYFAEKPN